jgi:hypothetical protein
MKNTLLPLILFLSLLVLGGCGQSFSVKQLGKGDIDFVADSHRQETERLLFELMDKLYKRNPQELRKQSNPNVEAQISRLQEAINKNSPLFVDHLEGIALLEQAFNPAFTGDRVFTLVGGLLSMIHKSYGYHTEFFIFDKLDKQKLYNAARNIEVASWRLRMSKNTQGKPLILSTELKGDETNLSFERLIAKLISMQDMMALIAADGDRRTINSVAQGVAKAVFLPI